MCAATAHLIARNPLTGPILAARRATRHHQPFGRQSRAPVHRSFSPHPSRKMRGSTRRASQREPARPSKTRGRACCMARPWHERGLALCRECHLSLTVFSNQMVLACHPRPTVSPLDHHVVIQSIRIPLPALPGHAPCDHDAPRVACVAITKNNTVANTTKAYSNTNYKARLF